MPVHWEPTSFEDFRSALEEKRCEVVVHRWTQEWVKNHGWNLWGIGFRRQFIHRVTQNEPDFWQAYNDGAFNLHMCETNDMWGR